ncbi:MAG TPA: DNA alkylation repair protein [Gemmatimonadaceae bacterium]
MADSLKSHYGEAIPRRIATMISAVARDFDADAFIRDALDGYEPLALTQRARHIAKALRRHLPDDFPRAADILVHSIGPKLEMTEGHGMAPFIYLPHLMYVAEHGLDHFEESMRAQYELTQRFSAEFSIRAFLERHPEATVARLAEWTKDPSPHVRRLVSEGTRPRLPWASRLRVFEKDPRPVLALLELLKDDPSLYVRRSVANHLNDIGKDHPELLITIARKWMRGASDERRWLIDHALRSSIKRGEPAALEVMGFKGTANVTVRGVRITPARPTRGDSVTIQFEVANSTTRRQRVLVDFRIHFVKANGSTSAKVFKVKELSLAPRESAQLSKKVSLKEMTTRKHYPGRHRVDVLLNGRARLLGAFDLR